MFFQNLREKTAVFKCETLQSIGAIPLGGDVVLKLNPADQNLIIHYSKKAEITLTYERIVAFRIERHQTSIKNEANEAGQIAGQILSTGLFGKTGKIVGGLSSGILGREKIQNRWIGTLIYKDKKGELQELNFIQKQNNEYYTDKEKDPSANNFERIVNEIACRFGENITEL